MRYDGEFVKERLDRATATDEWRELFPRRVVEVLPNRSSDHNPLLISFNGRDGRYRRWRKKIRFEAEWNGMEQPKAIIKRIWRVVSTGTSAWKRVGRKLCDSKIALSEWARKESRPVEEIIKKKTNAIEKLQAEEGIIDVGELGKLQKEVNELIAQEDTHLRQRAKVEWLKAGDKNSKFFHACIAQRRRSNQINCITDETGAVFSSTESIEATFINFFNGLFATSNPRGVVQSLNYLAQRVTPSMNERLLDEFTREEIRLAVDQMAPFKSPGPDGFPVSFYQKNWTEVGDEVCAAALNFFEGGSLGNLVNHSHIVLIPKTKNPTRVTDYRPISLCNVVYKIVAKVLANRLKLILPIIISSTQSAFIPGRLISDNILVAYETLHTMHARMWGREGYMAVKLDMSKAYDRVEWSFLRAVMLRLGFDPRWVGLTMNCISTVTYSIIVNGQPVGHIKPTRGLRQGDPLSPYLFLLCAEVLSSQLQQAEMVGLLRGVPTSVRGPRLNHLFFADDCLLFCKASVSDWQILTGILEEYEKASGQRLNRDKTSVFFSRNTSTGSRSELLNLIGIPASTRYDHYLGLPALVGKSRVREFQNIVDRVKIRVQDWKNKFLSQAGKEVLLKAVIQAIPTYCMSVFLLPKELCREINSIMQKFWWEHKENDRKIHWMSWANMGLAKRNGGMGFRDLHGFNKALLAKQGWRLVHDPNSLVGRIFKAKYFHGGSFLQAKTGSRPSFAWRSILGARELLKEGLQWRVGDGKSINIWGDKWIPRPTTYAIQSLSSLLQRDAKVAELIDPQTKSWNVALIKENFNEQETGLICNLPLSRYGGPDRITWRPSSTGVFTVRSAYYLEMEKQNRRWGEGSKSSGYDLIWRNLWSLGIPNATKVFLWRACKNILPTKENLCKRRVLQEDTCIFCHRETEMVTHILWECPSTRDVWSACDRRVQKSQGIYGSFMEVMEMITERCTRDEVNLFAVTAKKIWARRNSVLHEGVFLHPTRIVREAKEMLQAMFTPVEEDTASRRTEEMSATAKWVKPPFGRVKINWDVAFDKTGQYIGFGAIIRDHNGHVQAAKCMRINGAQTPVVGEALAAVAAMEFGKEQGMSDIILEGDSLQVVLAIKEEGPNLQIYGHIVDDVKLLLNSCRSWMVGHVRREANRAAHGLAKEGLLSPTTRIWRNDLPDCIFNIVLVELNALDV
jgi:ribonuclease HI